MQPNITVSEIMHNLLFSSFFVPFFKKRIWFHRKGQKEFKDNKKKWCKDPEAIIPNILKQSTKLWHVPGAVRYPYFPFRAGMEKYMSPSLSTRVSTNRLKRTKIYKHNGYPIDLTCQDNYKTRIRQWKTITIVIVILSTYSHF